MKNSLNFQKEVNLIFRSMVYYTKMPRRKLNKAYLVRKGNYADGRKRYVLEKEICGEPKRIVLPDPEKLWIILVGEKKHKKPV